MFSDNPIKSDPFRTCRYQTRNNRTRKLTDHQKHEKFYFFSYVIRKVAGITFGTHCVKALQ